MIQAATQIYNIFTGAPPPLPDSTPAAKGVQSKLDGLYSAIAEDLKQGKPLVISTNLVLWEEGRDVWWGNGEKPDRNLYWGAKYGLYTMLKNSGVWTEVYKKTDADNGSVLKVVFERTSPPGKFWRSQGVSKPFKTYVVINVFTASNIIIGYGNYARDLFTEQEDKIVLGNGKAISAGGKSRVVIYSGHMIPEGNLPLEQQKASSLSQYRKGTAIFACVSSSVFGVNTVNNNIAGLLYTDKFFAPEGYTHLPFYNSLIQGKTAQQIIQENTLEYKKYQRITSPAFSIYTNEDSF